MNCKHIKLCLQQSFQSQLLQGMLSKDQFYVMGIFHSIQVRYEPYYLGHIT